jgi:hypothetical protein
MGTGQVFSEYFGFACQPHFIPPIFPSSQSPGTGTIGQYMAAVPRGHPIWTPPPTIRIKKKLHVRSVDRLNVLFESLILVDVLEFLLKLNTSNMRFILRPTCSPAHISGVNF